MKTYIERRPTFRAVQYLADRPSLDEVLVLLKPETPPDSDIFSDTGNPLMTLTLVCCNSYLPAGHWLVQRESGACFVCSNQAFLHRFREKK